MTLVHRAVDWNRQKRVYDLAFGAICVAAVAAYAGITWWRSPDATVETLVIRGTGACAIAMLHGILAIGPLARLDPRFLPWLYNRRHLGVALFGIALVHGAFAIVQFHALGDENPLASVFTAYRDDYAWFRDGTWNAGNIPFEPFGVAALAVLSLMAATSHDFWLRQLGATFWKALHLGVYGAYGLLLAHVGFGALQSERPGVPAGLLAVGLVVLSGLHLAAARRGASADAATEPARGGEGWTDVGAWESFAEGHGKVSGVAGNRVAVFRHAGRVHATSNVCRHQGGPLGEGRIVDGCITCPWHGWNYRPEDGCSPPPFREIIATHDARVRLGRVEIRNVPNPLGKRCVGATDAGPGTGGES
jgi:nitrite reductase/ring-hydroxylating ferredoxin subunit/DMSO/TMAO reductase YedYZ heme-binding membrane subunit